MCNGSDIKGKLYAVGLGPGDPDLLTIKAVKILKKADIVIVPKAKYKAQSIAKDIVTRALGESLPFLELVFPMSRDKEDLEKYWDLAASKVYDLLKQDKTVVFVTLGDISLYSTFSYMEFALNKLDNTIKAELIPGISSIQLAAAQLEKPLALGRETYGVYPLPENIENLETAIKEHNTVLIMKIGKRLNELVHWLKDKGLLKGSSFIKRAGFPDEYKSLSLTDLKRDADGYLSIMMIRTGIC